MNFGAADNRLDDSRFCPEVLDNNKFGLGLPVLLLLPDCAHPPLTDPTQS